MTSVFECDGDATQGTGRGNLVNWHLKIEVLTPSMCGFMAKNCLHSLNIFAIKLTSSTYCFSRQSL